MSLNESQKRAVTHGAGPCLVLAGPGSGKTLTIAKRVENLIKVQKVKPEEILVITFTKYAAAEMKDRFQSIMGRRFYPVTFGTFHGIFYGILKWAYKIQSSNILDEGERRRILEQIIQSLEGECSMGDSLDDNFFDDLSEEIGNVKNNLLTLDEYQPKRIKKSLFMRIYQAYETEKKNRQKLDFEDMLLYCNELFVKRPDYLRKWQEKFRYILIDEFQDINQVQYDVIKMLAAPENNIFVVGDDDQSIYGFRGAKPGIMQDFVKDYKGTKQILLNINYRSDGNIVKGALRVIAHNKNRFEKEITPYHPTKESVHVQEVKNSYEEAEYVLDQVKYLNENGTPWEEMAVIFRTTEDARIMAEKFSDVQIPFYMREKIYNIYDHFIGKDIQSYLAMANGEMNRNHSLRIANKPNRYIARAALYSQPFKFENLRIFYEEKEWMQDRIDQWEWDLKMMKGKSPYAAVQFLRKSIGYEAYLKEYAIEKGVQYEKLKDVLDEIHESTKQFGTIGEWLEFLKKNKERLELMASQYNKSMEGNEGVRFLTVHGAKGLEFSYVFIIRVNDGSMPYKKAATKEEIEEERRLFYVAMTRAKKKLTISYPVEKNGKDLVPSGFLSELLYSKM